MTKNAPHCSLNDEENNVFTAPISLEIVPMMLPPHVPKRELWQMQFGHIP